MAGSAPSGISRAEADQKTTQNDQTNPLAVNSADQENTSRGARPEKS